MTTVKGWRVGCGSVGAIVSPLAIVGLIIDSGNIFIVADTQSSEVLVAHLPGDVHRLDVVIHLVD